ncbi:MAG: hypothetical protein Q8M02_11840 [Candidatus Didemnitutus sp.]|nr:hypothetical protein [Candidatus Didemnitutus sp.]
MKVLAPFVTTRRWLQAPHLGRFERQGNVYYWKLRRWVLLQIFSLRASVFGSRIGVGHLRHKAEIFRELLGLLKYQLVGAILLVAVLAGLDYVVANIVPEGWLPLLPREPLLALLSTSAQVSATLLGLYFAAVSVVASTAYARVPGEVRALVVADQAGTFYFGFLTRFCLLSILLLLVAALGGPIGFSSMAALGFLAVFGILSFIVLGLRTFSFFDPGSLVESLNRPLLRCFVEVTPQGFAWDDPSFQTPHHRHARHLLTCYENLVLLAEQKDNLNTRALLALGNGLIEILGIYPHYKSRIPTKSHWFQRRFRHKDWLTTSFFEVEIARATDTALQPEAVPDINWLETDCGKLLARILRSLLERGESAAANALLDEIQGLLKRWGYGQQVTEALVLFTSLQEVVRAHNRTAVFTPAPPVQMEMSVQRLALYDYVSLGLMNILLGWARYASDHEPESTIGEVENIDWRKLHTLYPPGIRPRPLIEQWESLRTKVAFELDVEGRMISPAWLLTEASALGYCRHFEIAPELIATHERWFRDNMKERVAVGDPVGAAHLGLRSLEAVNKIRSHLPTLEEWHTRSAAFNRSKDQLWPVLDWQEMQKRAEKLRKDITTELVGLIDQVQGLPAEKNLPDLFGQIYTVLAERCLEALLEEDRDTFRSLFPQVLSTALQAHQRIFSRHQTDSRQAFRLAMGPLGDLLALSGYALLSGDLVDPEFAEIATHEWNNFLATRVDDAARRTAIVQFAASTDTMLGFSPRAMLRFEWQRKYNAYLEGKGFSVGRGFYYGDPLPKHPSPLVRLYVTHAELYEADDLFLSAYLGRRAEANGIKMPHKVTSFAESLDRETKRKPREEAGGDNE